MFDEQIRQLEDKKSKLEESLWMAYDFDTQFEIKRKIEDIEREIEDLESEIQDEVDEEEFYVKDVIVEIVKYSSVNQEETPAYLGYTADDEEDVAFFSDDDLEVGEKVKVEIVGAVPCDYDYLLGRHANGVVLELGVERLKCYLRELNG